MSEQPQNDAAADAVYAVAVVRKQHGITFAEAQEIADQLSAETRAQLVALGRNGQIEDVRRLLGMLPPLESADAPKASKPKKAASKKADGPAPEAPVNESNA